MGSILFYVEVSHASTEHAEHIHIIITYKQKVDNMIPNQVQLLL